MTTGADARPIELGFDSEAYRLRGELAERALTPALVVFLDRVRANVDAVIARCGGPDRWRPHVKTAKLPLVFEELADRGLTRFKCATTREAKLLLEALDRSGVAEPDVLLAHPLRGPALERLGRIADEHPSARVSVLCEDPAVAGTLPARVGAFVDVNVGMDRTGLALERADEVEAVAAAAGERFRGVHGYEGHLHGDDAGARRAAAFAAYDALLELVAGLQRAGHAVEELVTSGTPTFPCALEHAGLAEAPCAHRVSPGTVVYHDARTEALLSELGLAPAALVLATVVSHPAPDLATCDAGSKSVAAEAGAPCARVLDRPDLVAQTPNEEHLPLRATDGRRPERGERLLLFPEHVCPTVNLAEEALIVERGEVVAVAPVAARAHELVP